MAGRTLLVTGFLLLQLAYGGARAAEAGPLPGGTAASAGTAILVLPFENSSPGPKLEWIGEGLAELGIERLRGEGRTVYPRETWQAALEKLGLPNSRHFSRATMIKIAEETDADAVVFGRYHCEGKALRISAQILRLDVPGADGIEGPALSPVFEESGDLAEMMDIHARLAWQLLRFRDSSFFAAKQEFVQRQTRWRLDAFEQYIRALSAAPGTLDDAQRLRLYREAAHLEPAWPEPLFALGQAYFQHKDCATALIWFSKVAPENERGFESAFLAGVCHLWRNDPARAEAAFAALSERFPLAETLNNLGIARAQLGKLREAIEPLRGATRLDPEEPNYWFNLGLALLSLTEKPEGSEPDAGKQVSGRNLGAPPRQPQLVPLAFPVRGDRESAAAAVRVFRELLLRRAEDSEGHLLLLAALERSGRTIELEAERENFPEGGTPPKITLDDLNRRYRVMARLPLAPSLTAALPAGSAAGGQANEAYGDARSRQIELLTSRGREQLAQGHLDQAEHSFARAARRSPGSPEAHRGLAEIYQRRGKLDEAIRELRASLWSKEDSATRVALAKLYLQRKRPADAVSELRAALQADPGSAEARQMLRSIESRSGKGEAQ